MLPPIAFSQEASNENLSKWVAYQKAKIQADVVQNRELETRTQKTLEQSQNILRLAESQNDQKTATVARQAITTAQNTLRKLRAAEQKDGTRLLALEKVQGWQTQVRELHPDTPTLLRNHRPSIDKGEVAVVTLRRDMYIKLGDQWVPFDGDTPLGPGDQIKTGADGHAEVMFSDNSKIDMGPNSIFTVAKIGEKESTYEFLKGKLHDVYDCVKKTDLMKSAAEQPPCGRIKVRTPTVAIGVRGTEFTLEVPPDGSALLTVLHGTVEFTDLANEHNTVMVEGGQQASMTAEGTIRGPTAIELKSIPKWWEETEKP